MDAAAVSIDRPRLLPAGRSIHRFEDAGRLSAATRSRTSRPTGGVRTSRPFLKSNDRRHGLKSNCAVQNRHRAGLHISGLVQTRR